MALDGFADMCDCSYGEKESKAVLLKWYHFFIQAFPSNYQSQTIRTGWCWKIQKNGFGFLCNNINLMKEVAFKQSITQYIGSK